MPEELFTGTTQAGRTLVLYFEHIAFDTFTDAAGEQVNNPTETKFTGTLDGASIAVDGLTMRGSDAVVVVTDQGTFTATSTDYAEDHADVLRTFLEWRPSTGWDVEVTAKAQDEDLWRYTVVITNGRLTERADFKLSPQVMRTLARGADVPTDEQVAHEIAQHIRSDKWAKIQQRAQEPTEFVWIAHPS